MPDKDSGAARRGIDWTLDAESLNRGAVIHCSGSEWDGWGAINMLHTELNRTPKRFPAQPDSELRQRRRLAPGVAIPGWAGFPGLRR
jgi:hypothetical protein